MDWTTLFQAGNLAIGGLLTLIIAKVIEGFNTRAAFKRDMNKLTYTRKLERAEKLYAFLGSYVSRMKQTKNAFRSIVENYQKDDFDPTLINQSLEVLSKQITEMEEVKYHEVYAALLYFNLPTG